MVCLCKKKKNLPSASSGAEPEKPRAQSDLSLHSQVKPSKEIGHKLPKQSSRREPAQANRGLRPCPTALYRALIEPHHSKRYVTVALLWQSGSCMIGVVARAHIEPLKGQQVLNKAPARASQRRRSLRLRAVGCKRLWWGTRWILEAVQTIAEPLNHRPSLWQCLPGLWKYISTALAFKVIQPQVSQVAESEEKKLHLFAFECTVDPKSTWTLKSHLMYELHCTRNKITNQEESESKLH